MQKDTEKIINSSSSTSKITVGQVDFINCLPVNIPFRDLAFTKNIKTINAIPSELNKMILNGEIDIAPISSYAYLQNKNTLSPIADLCIASDGPADSVILFSKYKINELNNKKIALSHASATSNKLINIILNNFMNMTCEYNIENGDLEETIKSYDAVLLIGDTAIENLNSNYYEYDLGELWKTHTGLPMVFALWVIRNDKLLLYRNESLEIATSLQNCIKQGLNKRLPEVISAANKKLHTGDNFYRKYFEHLNYDFNNNCKKGLEVFESYCLVDKI